MRIIKNILFFVFIALFPLKLYPQHSITISGFVLDSASGEKLIGASVIDSASAHYSITNINGYFSLETNSGNQKLKISYVGHIPRVLNLNLPADTFLNILLGGYNLLSEVVISGYSPYQVHLPENPGRKNIPMEMIRNTPVIMGERDVMKIAQMMPGIQGGSEANSGLFVRGGEGDQNLILLDGMEVFNPDHLFGFFSVFNDDAFKSVQLYTSDYPAKYNGRLSSVLDIRTRDGDSRRFHVNGSIGLISSKLQVQGPMIRDKLTFIVSYRRTYLGILAKPIIRHFTDYTDAAYYFQDINARVRWNISPKNTLTISNYTGEDLGYFNKEFTLGINPPDTSNLFAHYKNEKKFNWGNQLWTVRMESALTKKLFLNISSSYSNYLYSGSDNNNNVTKYWENNTLTESKDLYSISTKSRIENYSALFDLDYFMFPGNKLSAGGGYKQYHLNPRVERLNSENLLINDSVNSRSEDRFISNNYFIYLQDEITLFKKLSIVPGLHYTMYSCAKTNSNNLLKRLSINYIISNAFSMHGSYSEMEQYHHLFSLSRISLASDLWLPSFGGMSPSQSRNYSIGLVYSKGDFTIGLDGYYRKMNHLYSYIEGISFLDSANSVKELITEGNGKAYGVEFYLEKPRGRLTGMLSYSYSRSTRQFDEINLGREFFARYDRPHVLKTNLVYSINANWNISAFWNIMSGSLQTAATNFYISWFKYRDSNFGGVNLGGVDFSDIAVYKKNSIRLPMYQRLDISASYVRNYKRFTGTLNFGFYNVYNARNAYEIQVITVYGPPAGATRAVDKKVLFPVLSFVSYRLEL